MLPVDLPLVAVVFICASKEVGFVVYCRTCLYFFDTPTERPIVWAAIIYPCVIAEVITVA